MPYTPEMDMIMMVIDWGLNFLEEVVVVAEAVEVVVSEVAAVVVIVVGYQEVPQPEGHNLEFLLQVRE